MKRRVIAIHSSRGGTGKTMIATNLAATYANDGLNVALLDLDFRAPSLMGVFSKGLREPIKHWLNDFMDGRCSIKQALVDVSEGYNLKGRLLIGLANPAIDAIRNMMGKSRAWEVTAAKKLFSLKSTLFDELNIDCCIFDVSPGIQYSSLNAVISSDLAILVTTFDSLDIKGVQRMFTEFYDEFEKKPVVLMNKVFPQTQFWSNEKQRDFQEKIEKTLKHPVIGVIPCYCDVLQAKRTSLLAIEKPDHPFVKDLKEVAERLEHAD